MNNVTKNNHNLNVVNKKQHNIKTSFYKQKSEIIPERKWN